MDGTRSVKQLVVAYFSEYGSIAFSRVTDLVAQFRAANFLTDPQVDVYAEVARQSRKGTLSYKGESMWRAFLQKELAIGGLDNMLAATYRYGFWVLFSKPALLLYPFIVIAGLAIFFYTAQQGTYPILKLEGKLIYGMVALGL